MKRIIRGVRIVTLGGMQAASVHVAHGQIVAIAGYDDIPRTTIPEELGKGVLMPGLIASAQPQHLQDGGKGAARFGVTTLFTNAVLDQPLLVHTHVLPAPPIEQHPLSLLLPLTWTAMRNRGESVESIVQTLCTKPAQLANIENIVGTIQVGMRADLVVWHPEYSLVNTSPVLYGQLRQTIVNGQTVYKDGTYPSVAPSSSSAS